MRELVTEKRTERREADGFDLLNPYEEPEVADEEENHDSDRILPPSRINPKTGKIDKKSNEPKDDSTVYIAPEKAQDPF